MGASGTRDPRASKTSIKRPIAFRRIAAREYDEAADWYDCKQSGLRTEFVFEVRRVLQLIAEQPDRYAEVEGGVREALVHRFPYCIYFRVRRDRIVILAVIHSSRDPETWRSRI